MEQVKIDGKVETELKRPYFWRGIGFAIGVMGLVQVILGLLFVINPGILDGMPPSDQHIPLTYKYLIRGNLEIVLGWYIIKYQNKRIKEVLIGVPTLTDEDN